MTNINLYLKIKNKIDSANAIIIGAGAGLSASAGLNYGTDKFKEIFPELVKEYGFTDMYTSSFYNFPTEEEKWSYWAKHINYLCISKEPTKTYKKLYNLVKDKNYFVITTNVDRQFIKAGFDEDKVFEIQGTLSNIQCLNACHNKLYDNTLLVKEMLKYNKDNKIPSSLVPKCPKCGGPMEVNLRKDSNFVEDDNWFKHNYSYEKFINDNKDKKLLFLELGVGYNTPGIIRYPFEDMTLKFNNAYLIRINDNYSNIPDYISDKSLKVQDDIDKVINNIIK